MGAYILRFPRAEILTLIPLGCTFLQCGFPRSTFSVLVSPTSILTLQAPSNIGMESGGIAYWAHGWLHLRTILGPLLGLFGQEIRGMVQDLGNLQALD